MKINNIASYSDVLVACMRQNPRWILLSEVRSGEAVMAVRNSISSGHNILSTIHSDKASSIPMRLYSLLESSQDIDQFLKSIHRYVQIGVHVKGYYSKALGRFQREITQVAEFYVDDVENAAKVNILFSKDLMGNVVYNNPTQHLIDYMASQGVEMKEDPFIPKDSVITESTEEQVINTVETNIVNNEQVVNTENVQPVVTEQVINTQPVVEQVVVENQPVVNNVSPQVENVNVVSETVIDDTSDDDNSVPGVTENLEIFEF